MLVKRLVTFEDTILSRKGRSLDVLQEQELKFQFIITLKRPKSNATKRYVRYVLTASNASLLKVRFADECNNFMSHFLQIEKKNYCTKNRQGKLETRKRKYVLFCVKEREMGHKSYFVVTSMWS